MEPVPNHLGQQLGVGQAVAVADVDALLLRGNGALLHVADQGLDGFLPALGGGHGDQMPLVVHVEDGLDVQQVPHDGLPRRQASAPAELAQVPHGEPVAEMQAVLLGKRRRLVQGLSLPLFLDGQVHEHPLAQGGAEGVHRDDPGLRELLPQVLGGDGSVVIRPAQAGGKAQVEKVPPALQDGPPDSLELLHVGGGGLGQFSLAEQLVEAVAVHGLPRCVAEAAGTDLDRQGDHGHPQGVGERLVKVTAGIRRDGVVSHVVSSPYFVPRSALSAAAEVDREKV